MSQHKAMDICDYGLHLIAIRYDNDKNTPYRVYVMRDQYHRKQIAKCEDLATCVSTAYQYIMNGG